MLTCVPLLTCVPFQSLCRNEVFQLQEQLQSWRCDAKKNGIPFFAFTLMRNPLSEFLSIYNYFCIYLGKLKHVDCPKPWTVDGMMSISPDNPQTRWLVHGTTLFLGGSKGERTFQKPLSVNSSQLSRIMEFHFDWVGTLESFDETLSVFRILGIKFVNAKKYQASGFNKITKDGINKTVISSIDIKLLEDKALYSWAQSRYRMLI